MSEFESEERLVAAWLQPLADASAPCGPDLEYDNDFLALTQASTGKPESQFGPAEAADWRAVVDGAESLLARSRDLRIAIFWLRAKLHLAGYGALPLGLTLINGMIDQLWDHLHPQPDPDDADPYARVNALTALREPDGLIGDLRESRLVQDRAIGELTIRHASVALGLLTATDGETPFGKSQVSRMLGDALLKTPALRSQCQQAVVLTRQLIALVNDKLGSDAAPDLRPLYTLVNGVAGLLPGNDGDGLAGGAGDNVDAAASAGTAGAGDARRSLSGAVTSREDAVRAIDLVCEYLERAEPTNPAPLFLRRGRQLIGQNFLQLIKALAPEALSGVAGMVGVDPDAVEAPDAPSGS